MLVTTCLPDVWGATRSPHRLALQSTRTECRLAGTADRDRADIGGETPDAVKGVTLCHWEAGTLFEVDQPTYVCLRSQSSLTEKVMEMKLHRVRDVRSDYGGLKQ